MPFIELIQKKRDGHELSSQDISTFVSAVTRGQAPDYQVSAFLMAVFFRGMTSTETAELTRTMAESGVSMDLSDVPGPKVDKHSTGGIGDKVSMILAPLAAACGLKVPMMAGRGLGHSGGTIDKLESITGYRTELPEAEFKHILKSIGCSIISQSKAVAPADRILYGLRDVTATVECIPLIVSSVLSKKIAEGTQGLVLDIKVGSGAFMKTVTQAKKLAKALTSVGQKAGLEVQAVLSNMDQPLGTAVGNSLEIYECVRILENKKFELSTTLSSDLKELSLHLCAQMLVLGGVVRSLAEGKKKAIAALTQGQALTKFREMVKAHGGDVGQIDDPTRLPLARKTYELVAEESGFLASMDCEAIGRMVVRLGGGRAVAQDTIDPGVGLVFHRKLGTKIKAGESIATVYSGREDLRPEMTDRFREAVSIAPLRRSAPPLLMGGRA